MTIPLTAHAASLPETVPFVGPEAQERARGMPFAARLGANESAFGLAPEVAAAIAASAADCWQYGDPEMAALRSALAATHGVTPDHVAIGEGIDGLMGTALRLLLEPGRTAVTSRGAYPTFNYHVAGTGARLVTVPYRDDRQDLAALAAAARAERASVVYLSNPDNPTGSGWDGDAIAGFVAMLPENCILFLDEAYGEFAPEDARVPLDAGDPRVLRLRTFSKAYGLAGLRVGYALCTPPLARAFDKLRNHFGVGRVVQAGALAALAETGWLDRTIAQTALARERIAAIARDNGLVPLPSATNFVAIDCGGDGVRAKAVLEGLLARGIFVRMPGAAPLDRCIRVTAAPDPLLDLFAEALPGALADADAVAA